MFGENGKVKMKQNFDVGAFRKRQLNFYDFKGIDGFLHADHAIQVRELSEGKHAKERKPKQEIIYNTSNVIDLLRQEQSNVNKENQSELQRTTRSETTLFAADAD